MRAAPTQATLIPKVELSTEEHTHFMKISGSLGAKMMAMDGMIGCKVFTSVGFHIDHPSRVPG